MRAAGREREAETWRGTEAGEVEPGGQRRELEVKSGQCGGWGREGRGGGRSRLEKQEQDARPEGGREKERKTGERTQRT